MEFSACWLKSSRDLLDISSYSVWVLQCADTYTNIALNFSLGVGRKDLALR